MRPKPELMRVDDGSLWEASCPDDYTDADAIAAIFSNRPPQYFFRELKPNPRKTWWAFWRPRYVRTGKTWEGEGKLSQSGFVMLKFVTPPAARPGSDPQR